MSGLMLPPGARPEPKKLNPDTRVGAACATIMVGPGQAQVQVFGGVEVRALIAAILQAGMIARGNPEGVDVRRLALAAADELIAHEAANPPAPALPEQSPPPTQH